MLSIRATTYCFALIVIATTGCSSKRANEPTGEPADKAPTTVAPRQFGTIVGTVRLAEAAELPEVPPEMMYLAFMQQDKPLPLPDECPPPKQNDRRPVRLGAQQALSSIFVAATDFKSAPKSREPVIHEVIIRECRLTPQVIGAMRGDTLRITSEADYPFMPQLGASGYVETLIKGQERSQKLEAIGVTPLLCGFTAPCGRADIITVSHPLYAVTNEAGEFRIDGVPTDEPIAVNAWHPLFKAATLSVTVRPGEPARADFTLSPESQYTPTGIQQARDQQQQQAAPGTRPD